MVEERTKQLGKRLCSKFKRGNGNKKKKGFKNTKHVIEEPVYIVLLVAVEECKGFRIALMCQLLAAMS